MHVLKLDNGVYELHGWTLPPLKKDGGTTGSVSGSVSGTVSANPQAPQAGPGQIRHQDH